MINSLPQSVPLRSQSIPIVVEDIPQKMVGHQDGETSEQGIKRGLYTCLFWQLENLFLLCIFLINEILVFMPLDMVFIGLQWHSMVMVQELHVLSSSFNGYTEFFALI